MGWCFLPSWILRVAWCGSRRLSVHMSVGSRVPSHVSSGSRSQQESRLSQSRPEERFCFCTQSCACAWACLALCFCVLPFALIFLGTFSTLQKKKKKKKKS